MTLTNQARHTTVLATGSCLQTPTNWPNQFLFSSPAQLAQPIFSANQIFEVQGLLILPPRAWGETGQGRWRGAAPRDCPRLQVSGGRGLPFPCWQGKGGFWQPGSHTLLWTGGFRTGDHHDLQRTMHRLTSLVELPESEELASHVLS